MSLCYKTLLIMAIALAGASARALLLGSSPGPGQLALVAAGAILGAAAVGMALQKANLGSVVRLWAAAAAGGGVAVLAPVAGRKGPARAAAAISGPEQAQPERPLAPQANQGPRDARLALFDEFPTLICRRNAPASCDYCNKSWLEFTGRAVEQELGGGWLEGLHPDDRERFLKAATEAFAARRPFEMEYRLRRHDGQYRWFLDLSRPFHGPDGSSAGYLSSCYDITEHKRLEEQLRQAQKMEAIGRLAGGVAHDFNNLLTAISGYASFARDALPAGAEAREDIGQVLMAAERASELTRQLLTFSRRQPTLPSIVNLNEALINLSKMLRRLISEDIELVAVPAADLGAVRVDAGQVEQVLVNLVVNAGDAMPSGGRLTIETANVTLDAEYAQGHVGVAPGDYCMLAVSDTGCGMTDEVKARLFEPFFTTKEPGKGTGLGLATCYGIVRQNDGHIWFYSEPGKGTTFKIYFPRLRQAAAEPRPGDEEALQASGAQTVLLVEDDPAVRSFAARVLRETGYLVLEAATGTEALAVAGGQGGRPIHLLVTDVVMPEMGGEELVRRLQVTYPELRALYISGYTANAVMHNGTLHEGVAFLQKPFTLATLARKVREALGGYTP